MDDSSDDRSSVAAAFQWVSRITTVAGEMAVPGMLGYWLDQKLGTKLVFVIVGVIGGCGLGLWHLMRLAAATQRDSADRDRWEPKK